MSAFSTPLRRPRSRLLAVILGALIALTAVLADGTAAQAAPPSATAGSLGTIATIPPLSALSLTGTRTTVTVRKVYRRGQVEWINHVLDTELTAMDGCQAMRTGPSWRENTYRAWVDAVCEGGPATARAAVAELNKTRPWYRISVTEVPLTGFTLAADVAEGNGDAVPAALAALPSGPSTFAEGDDTALTYVGPGVTTAHLDAAVTAFARALHLPADQITVTPVW